MLNFTLPTWAAPQTTGHPLGLPNPSAQPYVTTQVTPLRKTSDSALGNSGGRPHDSDTASPDERKDSDQPVAPPSALQLKIISILQEQAQMLTKDKNTDPDAASDKDTGKTKSEPPTEEESEAGDPNTLQSESSDPQTQSAYDDALRSIASHPDASGTLYLPSSTPGNFS